MTGGGGGRNKWVHNFTKGISPKMNMISQLEIEFASFFYYYTT